MINKDAVLAGQAIYSKEVLSIYNLWVLGFSNHLLWKCPTRYIGKRFSEQVSDNHLDVGVGTGYYLKKYLPQNTKRIALLDLNENSLASTASAIQHLNPEVYRCNVLEPLVLNDGKFDSISMNYLLHCLPGSLSEKSIVFSHLKKLMKPGAVLFGSTILGGEKSGGGNPKNFFAKKLMAIYNKKGIFSNANDDLPSLENALNQYFSEVRIEVIGCVALFSGVNSH